MSSHQDDLFDSVIFFEENCQKQGYEDGFGHGKLTGWQEGFEIGLQNGNELGAEVGFYEGFVLTWSAYCESNGHRYDRIKARIESLLQLLSQNWSDTSRDLITELEEVRGKFKQICSMLNINVSYMGTKASQLSF